MLLIKSIGDLWLPLYVPNDTLYSIYKVHLVYAFYIKYMIWVFIFFNFKCERITLIMLVVRRKE